MTAKFQAIIICIFLSFRLSAQTDLKQDAITFLKWEIKEYPINENDCLSAKFHNIDTLLTFDKYSFCSIAKEFGQDELAYLRNQANKYNRENIYLNKTEFKGIKIKKRKGSRQKIWYYSMPLLTSDREYAIIWKGYYSNPESSEDKVLIYKRSGDKWFFWKKICNPVS